MTQLRVGLGMPRKKWMMHLVKRRKPKRPKTLMDHLVMRNSEKAKTAEDFDGPPSDEK